MEAIFQLPGAKSDTEPKVDFRFNDYRNIIKLSSDEYFELPIIATSDISISAMSMIIELSEREGFN